MNPQNIMIFRTRMRGGDFCTCTFRQSAVYQQKTTEIGFPETHFKRFQSFNFFRASELWDTMNLF